MKCWEKIVLKTDPDIDAPYSSLPNKTFDEPLSVTITSSEINLTEHPEYNQQQCFAQTCEPQYDPQPNYAILQDQSAQYYNICQTFSNFENQSSSLSSSSSSSLSSGSYSTSYQTNQYYYIQNGSYIYYNMNDCSGI